MASENRIELRDRREAVIDSLTDSFARDVLTLDEFEERIDQAHRAETLAELQTLVDDLDAPGTALAVTGERAVAATAPGSTSLTVASSAPAESGSIVAIIGGAERRGRWRVPARLRTFALLGGAQLDLREAIFAPGVHEIHVVAFLGGVDIIVPPSVAIECDGTGIMGGFGSMNRAPIDPDPDRPLVRIRGTAILGGVSISTRLPGESERQAHKREKRARLAAKKHRKQLGH